MASVKDPKKSRVIVWLRQRLRLQRLRHFSHRLDCGRDQEKVDILLPKERREQSNTTKTIRGINRQSRSRRRHENPVSVMIKKRNAPSIPDDPSACFQHPSHAERRLGSGKRGIAAPQPVPVLQRILPPPTPLLEFRDSVEVGKLNLPLPHCKR